MHAYTTLGLTVFKVSFINPEQILAIDSILISNMRLMDEYIAYLSFQGS